MDYKAVMVMLWGIWIFRLCYFIYFSPISGSVLQSYQKAKRLKLKQNLFRLKIQEKFESFKKKSRALGANGWKKEGNSRSIILLMAYRMLWIPLEWKLLCKWHAKSNF